MALNWRYIKLKFHASSFLVDPRDIHAIMSLTCHEEIGRVGRGRYEKTACVELKLKEMPLVRQSTRRP